MTNFLDFFQLSEEPFGDTPDTRFLYLSPTHREALASLIWGIEANRGFVALIAKPGMGKTTLLVQLMNQLKNTASTAFVFETQCDSRDMMRHLLLDLGISPHEGSAEMHLQMKQFLTAQAESSRRVVLVIDESQNLQEPVLETLRLISDFETERKKLVQLILAGQPQFAERLALPSVEQLRQRLVVLAHIEALGSSEVAEYITHRLKVAGHPTGDVFTKEATDLIVHASKGIPREINTIAFSALSIAFATKRKKINTAIIHEALADHDLSPLQTQRVEYPPAATILQRGDYGTLEDASRPRRYFSWGTAAVMLVILFFWLGSVYRDRQNGVRASWDHAQAAPGKTAGIPVWAALGSAVGEPFQGTAPQADGVNATVKIPIGPTIMVQPGQTLYSISRQYLGNTRAATLKKLRELNPALGIPDHIEAGEIIQLPISEKQSKTNIVPDPAVGVQLSTTKAR